MTPETDLAPTLAALRSMAVGDTDYTPMVTVVGDLGRIVQRGPTLEHLATLTSGLAAVRDRLDPDLAARPLAQLRSEKADAFVGGVLWACTGVLDSCRRSETEEAERRRARRGRATTRQAVLRLAAKQAMVSPAEVRAALRADEVVVSASTVSKAITDLIESGSLVPADPPPSASRRSRFYRLAEGHEAQRDLEQIRQILAELTRTYGSEEVAEAWQGIIEEPVTPAAPRT